MEEEPVGSRELRVDVARNNSGRNVIHHDKSVEQSRMILREPRCDARASIVSNQCNLANSQFFEQFNEVERHGSLVVSRSWLVRFAVSPQIGSDHPITCRERWNLIPPRIICFRKPMKKDDGSAMTGVQIMLTDSVRMNGMMTDLHNSLPCAVRREKDLLSNFIEMRRSAISPVGTTEAITIRGMGIDVLQRWARAAARRQRVVPTARERSVPARRRRL